eukprot:s246_g4.t1
MQEPAGAVYCKPSLQTKMRTLRMPRGQVGIIGDFEEVSWYRAVHGAAVSGQVPSVARRRRLLRRWFAPSIAARRHVSRRSVCPTPARWRRRRRCSKTCLLAGASVSG